MNCKICDSSGLLPFILPDGTISKCAKVFCECHEVYGDNAHTPIPLPTEGRRPPRSGTRGGRLRIYEDDFDFPISYSFYRFLCQEHGWQDHGSDYPDEPIKPQEQVVIHRTSNMGKQEYDLLQQTALRAIHLEKQLNEHMKPKRKPDSKYGYRGIR